MKEEITILELLPIILETVQGIQNQFDELTREYNDFKNHTKERLDIIEVNMVKRENFNSLIKILEQKKIISISESAGLLIPNNNYLNK
jgi:hypothetical protein